MSMTPLGKTFRADNFNFGFSLFDFLVNYQKTYLLLNSKIISYYWGNNQQIIQFEDVKQLFYKNIFKMKLAVLKQSRYFLLKQLEIEKKQTIYSDSFKTLFFLMSKRKEYLFLTYLKKYLLSQQIYFVIIVGSQF